MMKKLSPLFATAALFIALVGPATAEDRCYEETPVAATLLCENNGSKSADFSSGCKYSAATVEKKEIQCPGRWVNTNGTAATHAATCAAAGLSTTTVSGAICASGERRPTSGANYGGINYKYGKWGNAGSGGITTSTRQTSTRNGAGDGDERPGPTYTYCWGSGQKRDHDGTDIVVAYACK